MPKPSEKIALINRLVAERRMKQGLATGPAGELIILNETEKANLLRQIQQEPMTWVMSILTYLDNEADMLARLQDAKTKEQEEELRSIVGVNPDETIN